MLSVFLGTCEAVRAMHQHVSGPSASYPPPSPSLASSASLLASNSRGKNRGGIRGSNGDSTEEEEEEEEEGLVRKSGEGEALIGGEGEDGLAGEEGAVLMERLGEQLETESEGKAMPWAHRDIKPVSPPSDERREGADEFRPAGQHHDRR